MRLWSIHPKYLDTRGIIALWRESLLAKEVLRGRTKGFKKHPQLDRFKKHKKPIRVINTYLLYILQEADRRGYNFKKEKIGKIFTKKRIEIPKKKIIEEFTILKRRLKRRDYKKFKELSKIKIPITHPLFISVNNK